MVGNVNIPLQYPHSSEVKSHASIQVKLIGESNRQNLFFHVALFLQKVTVIAQILRLDKGHTIAIKYNATLCRRLLAKMKE